MAYHAQERVGFAATVAELYQERALACMSTIFKQLPAATPCQGEGPRPSTLRHGLQPGSSDSGSAWSQPPAMPAFYTRPRTLADAIDFIVGRICDQLGVEHDQVQPWGSS